MELNRRQLLATGGACLASLGTGARLAQVRGSDELDALLMANAGKLPERVGAGANHYPMAAEALEALGYPTAIEDGWRTGAAGYAGEMSSVAAIERGTADADQGRALGAYERYADWLAFFRRAIAEETWRRVVGRWAPRLAPGLSGAAFHGLIRTGHAARALRARESKPRMEELASGLAYWAARYAELPLASSSPAGSPTTSTVSSPEGGEAAEGQEAGQASVRPERPQPGNLLELLADIESPWAGETTEVDFFAVGERLATVPVAPPVEFERTDRSPRADLDLLVRAATCGFLEMLVQERYRLWLLHTITGPAAVDLLLPQVDATGARQLVEYARQAVIAMYTAYGAPFRPLEHVRPSAPPWHDLIPQVVETRSVHGIKLTEALVRFDDGSDSLCRSVAAQWLEWR